MFEKLVYLPSYSPDFSPIELCWYKIKELLRIKTARTYEVFDNATAKALESFTGQDALGWFNHYGYCIISK